MTGSKTVVEPGALGASPTAVSDPEAVRTNEQAGQWLSFLSARDIHPKLQISSPGDAEEREADAVAERVMGMGGRVEVSSTCSSSRIQRKCDACEEEEEGPDKVSRKPRGDGGAKASAAQISAAVQGLGSGSRLPASELAFFEPRFARHLSAVRIHANAAGDRASRAVQARAFARGDDIAFAHGEYRPGTFEGRRLIAHELAHVLQRDSANTRIIRRDLSVEEITAQLAELERMAAEPVSMPEAEIAELAARRDYLRGLLAEATRARAGLAPVSSSPATPVSRAPPASTPGSGPVSTPSSGPEPIPAVPPEEMVDFVLEQRHFEAGASRPPTAESLAPGVRGAASGAGFRTNAMIQVIDEAGNQIAIELAQYGGGGGPHAEAQAIARLRMRLAGRTVPNGTLRVAVDQLACGGCMERLRALASELGLANFEVFVPSRPDGSAAGPKWTARTSTSVPARGSAGPPSPGGYRARAVLAQGEALAPSVPDAGPPVASTEPLASVVPEGPVSGPARPPASRPAEPVTSTVPEGPVSTPMRPRATAVPEAVNPGPIDPVVPTPAEAIAPPAAEPAAPEAAPRGGGWGGAMFSVGFVGLQFLAAYLHNQAAASRVRDQAGERGYVPPGSPSGEGLLYDIGAWLIDPLNLADRAVNPRDRVNVPVWRARIRDATSAVAIGATFEMTWQIGVCRFDEFGSPVLEDRVIIYRKQPDGTFRVERGDPAGLMDINWVISASVSDSAVEARVFEDPCSA